MASSSFRFKIYSCTDDVVDVDSLTIDFATAEFDLPPIVTAVTDENVMVHISNLTKSSAIINFSEPITGKVSYIIRERL